MKNRKKTYRALLVATASLAAAKPLLAQQAPADPAAAATATAGTTLPAISVTSTVDRRSYDAGKSNTATKTSMSLIEVPQTVNVIPRALLDEQNATSLQDALRNVPGLGFSVGDGQRDQVTIRGFNAITDQYVDGIRDDALYYRDLSNVERIDVLKGPAAVLYGRGSAGGIINRVLKKPQANPEQSVGVSLGTEGERRGDFDLGWNANDAARFRITGAAENSNSFRNQFQLNRQAIAPSAQFRIDRDTTINLEFDYLHDRRTSDQGLPAYLGRPVNVPIQTYYGSADAASSSYNDISAKSATASLDHRFNDSLSFHAAVRAYDFSLERKNYATYEPIKTAVNPVVTLDQSTRFRQDHGVDSLFELTQKTTLFGMKHELLYGVELSQQQKFDTLYSRTKVATYDLFNPQLVTIPGMPAGLTPKTNASTVLGLAGVYAQDLISLTEHWKVLAGVRFDYLQQTRRDYTAAQINLDRTDRNWSPRVGLIYEPLDWVSLYASYSQSFSPLADTLISNGAVANGSTLAPQKTSAFEIGSKFDIAGRASASVALFDMKQTNQQIADPSNPSFSLPIGTQRSRGLELGLTGEIAPKWSVYAGYTYMNGSVDGSPQASASGLILKDNTPGLMPRHSASIWLKRDLPYGFYAAGGAQFQSARYTSASDAVTLPSFVTFDLGAGYHGKKVDVTLTLDNLFDRKYFIAAHGNADMFNMPGAPRTLTATARWHM
ncbi:TonB-dependent receptor [Paraburkholderia flava]|uniref:TonB-dependent receptor n=1 Tax=Paraburkholderia flava TaxID=2547393 RepID=UPI00105E2CE2|nr:TonB-dependent siderophore receptor [Paraburkholderia flava]